MTTRHIYLIPGFFGFASFGDFKYFAHVRQVLERAFADAGPVALHYVPTRPTAGLRRRAARLLEVIAETASDQGPIHLIGHSTGGLDARLLTAPGVQLPSGHSPQPWVSRVRSVVSVTTPHLGAPMARVFATAQGELLLRFLSVMTLHVVRLADVPVGPIKRLVGAWRGAALADVPSNLLDSVYKDVLSER